MRRILLLLVTLFTLNTFAQKVKWTEAKLKEYWIANGADKIEGIYEDAAKSYDGTKYKYGLIKTDSVNYKLIYLYGIGRDQAWQWNEGDFKALLLKTSIPDYYKVKWVGATKELTDDLHIIFKPGFMDIVWTNGLPQDLCVKVFPTVNDKVSLVNNGI